jgi:hypothetical protein
MAIHAKVYTTTIYIYIGKVEVMMIEINPRMHTETRKRARNLAVGVHTSWIGGNSGDGMWKSMSIREAFDLIDSMELDGIRPDFVKMCKDRGWTEELPLADQGQLELTV